MLKAGDSVHKFRVSGLGLDSRCKLDFDGVLRSYTLCSSGVYFLSSAAMCFSSSLMPVTRSRTALWSLDEQSRSMFNHQTHQFILCHDELRLDTRDFSNKTIIVLVPRFSLIEFSDLPNKLVLLFAHVYTRLGSFKRLARDKLTRDFLVLPFFATMRTPTTSDITPLVYNRPIQSHGCFGN